MFQFGERSDNCLQSVHEDLQLIHRTAIRTIRVDYGVHSGGRTIDEQLEAFLSGASQLDPRKPEHLAKAMHVITPDRPKAMATDIHIAVSYQGKPLTWQKESLIYVQVYLIATADRLLEQGRISHRLMWGYNWDMDSIIGLDHDFKDLPHNQLVKA